MALAPPQFESKIKLGPALIDAVALLPRPLVFTNGVFDVLHRGHVTYLAEARRQGYSLLVALNSDASARRLGKGPERPINNQDDRAALIAALGDVDCVTLFDEDTPYQLIELVRPDVLVKGGDYDMSRLAEAELVTSYGGRALAIDFVHQRSTSALVKRIRESAT